MISQQNQTETELDRTQRTHSKSKAIVPQASRSVQIQSQAQIKNIENNEPNSTLYILTPTVKTPPREQQQRRVSRDNPSSVYIPKPNRPEQANRLNPPRQPRQTALAAVQPVKINKIDKIDKIDKTVTTTKPTKQNKSNNTNKNNEKKQPPVKRLAHKFKKNGMGTIDSYFNAYFFYYEWKSAKQGRNTKDYLRTIAKHPKGWGKNKDDSEVYEENTYDKYLRFLTFIAQLWGILCAVFSPARKFLRASGEFFSTLGNSSKAAKNIGYVSRKALNFLVPAAVVFFTVTTILNISAFKPELELTFNGKILGYVDSKETVAKAVSLVENNVSSVLNEQYEFGADLSYRIVLTKNRSYVSETEIYNTMYNSSSVQNAITTAYGLYIDGELVVAVESASDIDAVLNEVLAENAGDTDDETIEFVNDIKIIENKYAKRDVVTQDQLKSIISYSAETSENPEAHAAESAAGMAAENNGGNKQSESYESEELNAVEVADSEIPLADGDFEYGHEDIAAMAAASALELTPEDINAIPRGFLNSASNPDEISHQDDIISKLAKPSGNMAAGSIQFKKTKTETYNVEVPFDVKYVDSEQYYTGTQTVQTNGKNGENTITAEVTYIGDDEISREIISTEVIREPVTKVVLVGTKVKPVAAPTGKFIRPVKGGYLTSRFSGGHRGLDLVVPTGTPIYASDGGTVIYAGYSGSYGYHVKIRHGDGFVTVYAHMSSISTEYGEKLFQGQEIGKVGSTGYSTGPHLHFEIMKNGILVNPESYLK